MVQHIQIELADRFLWSELDIFFAEQTLDVWGVFTSDGLDEYGFFKFRNLLFAKLSEFVFGVFEDF